MSEFKVGDVVKRISTNTVDGALVSEGDVGVIVSDTNRYMFGLIEVRYFNGNVCLNATGNLELVSKETEREAI